MGRTRTLDSHASRLRRKLDPEAGRFVVNCWGVGYRLIEAPRPMMRRRWLRRPAAWPLALACATVVVAERVRTRRRRERLNRALHELRRPLQALVLRSAGARAGGSAGHLELALEALADLDREVNGGARRRRRSRDGRDLAARVRSTAGDRAAALAGRRLELAWALGAPGSRATRGRSRRRSTT